MYSQVYEDVVTVSLLVRAKGQRETKEFEGVYRNRRPSVDRTCTRRTIVNGRIYFLYIKEIALIDVNILRLKITT